MHSYLCNEPLILYLKWSSPPCQYSLKAEWMVYLLVGLYINWIIILELLN